MKKIEKFLIAFALLLCFELVVLNAHSQEVKQVKNSPFVFSTKEEAISTAKLSTYYIYVKGVKYMYYVSTRGSYYYVIQDKKGQWKRQYNKELKK